ncbi:MAG: RNA polymerase sigma factor (sigma-70 family) [Verrucomicrobiales bacterium]|jgi:RNA polymerase sigma factor (sigma-70 family)
MANGAFGVHATDYQHDVAAAGQTFAAFFSANRNSLVRALSMTIGDSSLAAEAVDEAMTRAVQRWDKVGTYSRPEGWVYRVAYNWATSRFRRRKRDRDYAPRIARPEADIDPEFDPSIEEALATLSEDHRSVLVLRYFYDWDVQATAAALEISPGTVKSRTSRALEAMAERLPNPSDDGALS